MITSKKAPSEIPEIEIEGEERMKWNDQLGFEDIERVLLCTIYIFALYICSNEPFTITYNSPTYISYMQAN